MQLSLEEISQALVTLLQEPRLLKELKSISTNFTSNRKDIEAYTLSAEMVAAYTSFYMPTNIPKLGFVLNQLPKQIRDEILETYCIVLFHFEYSYGKLSGDIR